MTKKERQRAVELARALVRLGANVCPESQANLHRLELSGLAHDAPHPLPHWPDNTRVKLTPKAQAIFEALIEAIHEAVTPPVKKVVSDPSTKSYGFVEPEPPC